VPNEVDKNLMSGPSDLGFNSPISAVSASTAGAAAPQALQLTKAVRSSALAEKAAVS
jgi:hypothetical protein